MDTVTLKLLPDNHKDKDMEIFLQEKKDNDFYDIPNGRELVFNDDSYTFILPGITLLPSKVYINDEAHDIELCKKESESVSFRLRRNDNDKSDNYKPFLECFGAIKIEIELDNVQYCSKSIAVMVSNTNINNGVLNMIEFIYNNCEDYLYEEHRHSLKTSGIKADETVSLEAIMAYLEYTLNVYKQSYQYLKTNPYAKLEKTESVDSFDKLQSVSQRTIRYITNNIDELAVVNYDTGIRFNNQYYQPNRILVERNSYSYDVYENKIIIGFLKTVVYKINEIIKYLLGKTYSNNNISAPEGYIDSIYQIFSRSIRKINSYIDNLKRLKNDYQQLYYFYSKIFNISASMVTTPPNFTPVFRSVNAYRQIYTVIRKWFSMGNYDLGKDELLLSFISTSKIYEYYCLIKILCHIRKKPI